MNLNQLAKKISEKEGKKVQVNIAQIKEILKCLIEIAAEAGVEGLVPQYKGAKLYTEATPKKKLTKAK